jgi:hypothetical protein
MKQEEKTQLLCFYAGVFMALSLVVIVGTLYYFHGR